MPVEVTDFVEVQNAFVRFTFDPTLAMFTGVNLAMPSEWPGLRTGDFDRSQEDVGIIDLEFDNGRAGVTNPGGDEKRRGIRTML